MLQPSWRHIESDFLLSDPCRAAKTKGVKEKEQDQKASG